MWNILSYMHIYKNLQTTHIFVVIQMVRQTQVPGSRSTVLRISIETGLGYFRVSFNQPKDRTRF